jgi:AcrR family transcriptional regulator
LYHHYPSKQHLLLDLIEEFYEELLATLGRIEKKASAKRDRLYNLIRAHLNLHREMPWHFRLVERDCGCLNEEQQARVQHLREQYERKLLVMLGARSRFSESGQLAAGHAIAALLNSAPSWLTPHSLDEREHDELLENMMSGAIERLLAPRRAVEAISLASSIEKTSKKTEALVAI